MSTRSTREGALAQTPSPTSSVGKRVVLSLLSLAVVLLFIGFEVGIRHVPPDAVQVSQSYVESGDILLSREITDARTDANAYARANSLPTVTDAEQKAIYHCGLNDPSTITQYTVRFTRWGLPVMVVSVKNVCPVSGVWVIRRGGLPGEGHTDPRGIMQDFIMSMRR